MGRYTSDHKVTTRDGSGRIVNEYVAKDQVDVAKVGGSALGPIMVVAAICLLFLLAFPLLAYGLLLWNINQARRPL